MSLENANAIVCVTKAFLSENKDLYLINSRRAFLGEMAKK